MNQLFCNMIVYKKNVLFTFEFYSIIQIFNIFNLHFKVRNTFLFRVKVFITYHKITFQKRHYDLHLTNLGFECTLKLVIFFYTDQCALITFQYV